MRPREIYLDMRPGGVKAELALHKGESGIPLLIGIFEGGASSDMSEFDSCTLLFTRPSGDTGEIACTIDGDTVLCTVSDELTCEAGQTMAELAFMTEDGAMVVSEPITVTVTGTAKGKADEVSKEITERYQKLDKAIELAQEARESYEASREEFVTAMEVINKASAALNDEIQKYGQSLFDDAVKTAKEEIAAKEQGLADRMTEALQGVADTMEKWTAVTDERLTDAIRAYKEAQTVADRTLEEIQAKADESVQDALRTYKEAQAKMDEAVQEIQGKADMAMEDTRRAEDAYKAAVKALQEATAQSRAVSPLMAFDAAKQAQRGVNEALQRLDAIEAWEESMIKRGGGADEHTSNGG